MTVLEPVRRYLAGIRVGRRVSLTEVMQGADRPRKPVLRVLDKLAREGYLREVADSPIRPGYGECGPPRRNPTWEIVRSVDARPRPESRPRCGRDRAWKIMRAKGRFRRSDLVQLAGLSLHNAENYTKLLARAGYIRPIGRDGHEIVWLLVKDRGPRRPNISDKEVWG